MRDGRQGSPVRCIRAATTRASPPLLPLLDLFKGEDASVLFFVSAVGGEVVVTTIPYTRLLTVWFGSAKKKKEKTNFRVVGRKAWRSVCLVGRLVMVISMKA